MNDEKPVLDVWVNPLTLDRSYLPHGHPLAPFDKREYVGALVWSRAPEHQPIDPPSAHVVANLNATAGYALPTA